MSCADGKSTLRCELRVVAAIGSNGVCADKDNITFHLSSNLPRPTLKCLQVIGYVMKGLFIDCEDCKFGLVD
jgi:hypothetical protein